MTDYTYTRKRKTSRTIIRTSNKAKRFNIGLKKLTSCTHCDDCVFTCATTNVSFVCVTLRRYNEQEDYNSFVKDIMIASLWAND